LTLAEAFGQISSEEKKEKETAVEASAIRQAIKTKEKPS